MPAFIALVVLLVFYLFTVPVAARRDGDFVHLWVGGRALIEGGAAGLYDPALHARLLDEALPGGLTEALWAPRNAQLGAFFYPPPAGLLYAPLGALPLRTAAAVHGGLVIGAAALAAWGLARLGRREGGLGLVGAGALIGAMPSFFFSFVLGQNGVFTLLVILAGLGLLLRGRPGLGGLVWGLLVAKPSWALALAPLPLFLFDRRAAGWAWGGMALGGGLGVAASLVLGVGPWLRFVGLAPQLAALDRLPGYPLDLQFNLWSLPRRVFGVGGLADGLGALLCGIAVVAGLWAARGLPRLRALALGLCVATAVNPHVHHYDMMPPLLGLALVVGGGGPGAWALLAFHHLAPMVGGWLGVPLAALSPLWIGVALVRGPGVKEA